LMRIALTHRYRRTPHANIVTTRTRPQHQSNATATFGATRRLLNFLSPASGAGIRIHDAESRTEGQVANDVVGADSCVILSLCTMLADHLPAVILNA
jgi:hypothetical protein